MILGKYTYKYFLIIKRRGFKIFNYEIIILEIFLKRLSYKWIERNILSIDMIRKYPVMDNELETIFKY